MTLSGLASKYAQLYIVTKGADLLKNTPRRDGDLLYNFSNYVVDDPDYVNNDYDAFSTGMVVLAPPASGQKVSIYFKKPLNKTDGAPIWVSLRLSNNTLSPQNTLQTPLVTGDADVLGVNQLGVSSNEQVALPLPSEAPPPQPTPTPNVPYYALGSKIYHVSFTQVPPHSFLIAFTDPPTTGNFYFFFLYTSDDPGTLNVTCDNDAATVNTDPVGSNSGGYIYRIYGYCPYSSLNSYKQIVVTPSLSGTSSCKYVWSFYN